MYNCKLLPFSDYGNNTYTCVSQSSVSYTVCGGTCGPSGFIISLDMNGLSAGLSSTCKCCTPEDVDYEEITFNCLNEGSVAPKIMTLNVPTKQTGCMCYACSDGLPG